MSHRLPIMIEALGHPQEAGPVRRLIEEFGGVPAEVTERLIGEPPRRSTRLRFASGGEIILHDDAVAAVLLHLTSPHFAPRRLDLSKWLGVGNDATLDALKKVIDGPRHFAGISTPYFAVDGGFVRPSFQDNRGWNDRGNLRRIVITSTKPGSDCAPEADDCPTCSDLLIRTEGTGDVDVAGTIDSLTAAASAGDLRTDTYWVKLADLQPLHDSGLMARTESQLTCNTCHRIICFTLVRNARPRFSYEVFNTARNHSLEPIPPVEWWGDEDRIAAEAEAMQYVDHQPGAWFLVAQQEDFYLHARYSLNSMVDDSALIRLNDDELAAYRVDGSVYLDQLSLRVNNDPPHREKSEFHDRDLYRQDGASELRATVKAAIVNHTWLAQQRRPH